MPHQDKLGKLIRLNARRRQLPAFMESVKAATGLTDDELSFQDLDVSDPQRHACGEFIQSGLADESRFVCYELRSRNEMEAALIEKVMPLFKTEVITVFFQLSEILGALQINVARFPTAAFGLLSVDRDCVYVCDGTGEVAVVLDRSVDNDCERFELCIVTASGAATK